MTNTVTHTQEEQFIEFLKSKDLNWWHWVSNGWLVVDYSYKQTTTSLSDAVVKIFPNVRFMIFEVTDSPPALWTGFGPDGNGEDKLDMFSWIKSVWQ